MWLPWLAIGSAFLFGVWAGWSLHALRRAVKVVDAAPFARPGDGNEPAGPGE